MSIDDNENIYILNEEQSEEDSSPLNFAAYHQETDAEIEEEGEEHDRIIKRSSVFMMFFKIMFNPVEGWKSMRRSGISVDNMLSACFYPLLAILALSKFSDYFYSVNVSLTQVITEAIVAFVAFFLAYFCIPVILSWVLPQETAEKFETKYGKQYTLVALSSLVLFSIVTDLLPMLWPILIFLPIWTLYIMFKGVRFFKLPQNQEMKFYILASAAVIALPLLIDYVLNLIMPY